jgi:hypothetical protein
MLTSCRSEPPPSATSGHVPPASSPSETVAATAPSARREPPSPTSTVATEPARANTAAVPAATAPAVAIGSPPFLPLADAKVGEWCRYRMRDDQVEEVRITNIEAGVVGIELKMSWRGKPLGLPTIRPERADEDAIAAHARRVGAQVTAERAVLDVAGRRWPCRLVTESWLDEGVRYVRRTWCCEAAPVYGVVQMEQTTEGQMTASMELVDFGAK